MNISIILTNISFIYTFLRGYMNFSPQCCKVLSETEGKLSPFGVGTKQEFRLH